MTRVRRLCGYHLALYLPPAAPRPPHRPSWWARVRALLARVWS